MPNGSMRREGAMLSGGYGTHPMDKYDRGAVDPVDSGLNCANCGREIVIGEEVWRYVDVEQGVDIYVDSVGCLSMFTAKYDVDIDEFKFTIIDGTEAD